MQDIINWAIKYRISAEAVEALRHTLNVATSSSHEGIHGESEAAATARVRLEASRVGARLWRNNSGAGYLKDGSFVRWGLCNESEPLNRKVKSADLIGILPVEITPKMVGRTIGQFCAREMKPGGWQYGATPREEAQNAFLKLVLALGGNACFATGEGTF